ncbi:MAG: hypothetical protein ACOC1H_01710 [Desulfosalsimonas sp.]
MHQQQEEWDWTPGQRKIGDFPAWRDRFSYMEEPYVSGDGEKIAAIVKTEDETFTVCVNGTLWEAQYDKVWHLRFAPDQRALALVSDMAMWTVAVDGTAWTNWYEFVWKPCFGKNAPHITAAAQKELRYRAVTNDVPWENEFFALTYLTVSPDGKTAAAVVQDTPLPEADIEKFQESGFTVAINGKPWKNHYVNIWELAFSENGDHLAAELRTSLYDYTIAVDDQA